MNKEHSILAITLQNARETKEIQELLEFKEYSLDFKGKSLTDTRMDYLTHRVEKLERQNTKD